MAVPQMSEDEIRRELRRIVEREKAAVLGKLESAQDSMRIHPEAQSADDQTQVERVVTELGRKAPEIDALFDQIFHFIDEK